MGRHSDDFLVRPLDTVWFRGPRPFVAGEDSSDPGLFPPTPRTFQGLVRTRLLLAALPGDLDLADRGTITELVGPPDRLPEGWRLEGPFPAQDGESGHSEPWFPAPAFLLRRDGLEPARARPAPTLEIMSDLPGEKVLLGNPKQASAVVDGWISVSNLWWAVTGEGKWDADGHRRDLPPFVEPEERPGVRIERDTATAMDHMLYAGTHYRFAPGSGLLGRLTAMSDSRVPDDALFRGWGQTGRKSRLVELRGPIAADSRWSRLRGGEHLRLDPAAVPGPLLAWVTLLTPALMAQDGALPFSAARGGVRVQVVGRLAGAGPDIGGFDRAAGSGRPVRSTWAAGSSWLVRIAGGSADERLAAARELQGLAPHAPDAFESMGFGQRVVGLLDPETYLPIRGGADG